MVTGAACSLLGVVAVVGAAVCVTGAELSLAAEAFAGAWSLTALVAVTGAVCVAATGAVVVVGVAADANTVLPNSTPSVVIPAKSQFFFALYNLNRFFKSMVRIPSLIIHIHEYLSIPTKAVQ